MKLYLAPLEGVTGYIYRNACAAIFPGADKYLMPFITPKPKKGFTSKERNDILPEHNEGICAVPQILTNHAEDFVTTAQYLREYGYGEINLNLGCPSGTVTSKGKGAGFLGKTRALDEFLYTIYERMDGEISIKTRIGVDEPEEFYELLEIYNKYPVKELTVHPRLLKDYYKNTPDRGIYQYAQENSKNPLCYNGDIFSAPDYEELVTEFPQTQAVMLGRGMIKNPGLIRLLKEQKPVKKDELKGFHDMVWEGYLSVMSGDINAIYKMRELWLYMGEMFTEPERYIKKIKKADSRAEYQSAVNALFREQELLEQ